jgi:hypothetical protein
MSVWLVIARSGDVIAVYLSETKAKDHARRIDGIVRAVYVSDSP